MLTCISDRLVETVSEQNKRIGLIALAAISCIAALFLITWCYRRQKNDQPNSEKHEVNVSTDIDHKKDSVPPLINEEMTIESNPVDADENMQSSKVDSTSCATIAENLRKEGKIAEAAEKYKEALSYGPLSDFHIIDYGEILLEQNEYQTAEKHFADAKQTISDDSDFIGFAYRGYAKALVKQGKHSQAVEPFETAEKLFGKPFKNNEESRIKEIYETLSEYVETLFRLDRHEEAVEKAQTFMINPKYLLIKKDSQNVFRELGIYCLKQKKYEKYELSKMLLKKVFKLDPEEKLAKIGYAKALRNIAQSDFSWIQKGKALHVYPSEAKFEGVEKKCKKALALDPKNPKIIKLYQECLQAHGEYLIAQKKYFAATEQFCKIAEINPNDPQAKIAYTQVFPRITAALVQHRKEVEDKLKSHPQNQEALDAKIKLQEEGKAFLRRAKELHHLRKFEEALQYFEFAAETRISFELNDMMIFFSLKEEMENILKLIQPDTQRIEQQRAEIIRLMARNINR